MTVRPIGILRTCYPDKFGTPRQSGLVPEAWGRLEFEPEFRRMEAVRGLDDFSHLWLVFQFHAIEDEPIALTVRPPRAGGNERRGVFATRSPFRPNRLGLTLVRLERVVKEGAGAPMLEVTGVDLIDGTPILDIKPYVPYADAPEDTPRSWADDPPVRIPVTWQTAHPSEPTRRIIEHSLSLRPQPAYQQDAQRCYATEIAGWHLEFTVHPDGVKIHRANPA
ncbi:MAG: tRNA (N6-threonylcarbamoyladenosine(37)-N6)-methyltransferase TrmO [Verrucomicrobiales bacterium]|nr:tRNA (N6-threonylcarbamoyladenosine(37)-N6)-methyltransferase TrmO [Verrucomicrobiales bacterium]